MTSTALHILDPRDTVAVALVNLGAGEDAILTSGSSLRTLDNIPVGHKVALRSMVAGEPIVKYGHVIGRAVVDIHAGQHVHGHNLEFVAQAPGATAGVGGPPAIDRPLILPARRTFRGIRRSDGSVATRNFLAVVSTVNCSATVSKAVVARAEAAGLLDEYPTIDGIVAVTHDQGCGHGDSIGPAVLRRTLAGYTSHPNVGGVVVIGLGCEMNGMDALLAEFTLRPEVPLTAFTIQEVGGTRAAIARALAELRTMAPQVAAIEREEVGVDELVVGLNCGGSDGWSAITANPAVGYASDLVVALGGRTVLAETPEIYGAEDLLLRRAVSADVADALLARLRWWEQYTAAAGGSMDNNPSPGNKDGGITTILEKSLGAVAKGGHAPLQAVYAYAERITARGLSFMDTPGYDPVSVTGLIAGGCNLIVFTTGRGSAIGTRPAPTVKLATNSRLFRQMADDMDIDCGDIVELGTSIEAKGLEIFHTLLDVASGERTRSEELGYGEHEFVPWRLGTVI